MVFDVFSGFVVCCFGGLVSGFLGSVIFIVGSFGLIEGWFVFF